MTAQSSQAVTQAGITPAQLTPQTTDTINEAQFGPFGLMARIVTTGTATNVTVSDPTLTGLNNVGTPAVLAAPATGVRALFIPRAAINPATGVATLNFSSVTGVTYELYRA